jgi:hypothetical protein
VVSFTLPPLYLPGKSPRYSLDRRSYGPQSRSGRRGEEKILDITGIRTLTPRSSSPAPRCLGVQFQIFLTSALDGREQSASRPGRFTPTEDASGTHWMGGWVGLRGGQNTVEKRKIYFTCQETNHDSSVIQSVAQSLY